MSKEFNTATQFIAPFFVTDKERAERFKQLSSEMDVPQLAQEMRDEFRGEVEFTVDSKSKLTGVLLDLEDHADWNALAESTKTVSHAAREQARRSASDPSRIR